MIAVPANLAAALAADECEPVYVLKITKSEGIISPSSTPSYWAYISGAGGAINNRLFSTGPLAWTTAAAMIADEALHEGRLSRDSIGDVVARLAGADEEPGGLSATGSFKFVLDNTDGALAGAAMIPSFSGVASTNFVPVEFIGRDITLRLTEASLTSESDSVLLFTGIVSDVQVVPDAVVVTVESKLSSYDRELPPNKYEAADDDFPRGGDGRPIPLVFGAHEAAPGMISKTVDNFATYDVSPVVKFADVEVYSNYGGISNVRYQDDGFSECGPAYIATGSPTGFSDYTPYTENDPTAEIGFTQEAIEELVCWVPIRLGGYFQDLSGLASYIVAVDPENAIDGDETTYSECKYDGSDYHVLYLRLPRMTSSGQIVRDETAGTSAIFLWWKADVLLTGGGSANVWFLPEKTSTFADIIGPASLFAADSGSIDTIGGAGVARWRFDKHAVGSPDWTNFATLADLSRALLRVFCSGSAGDYVRVYDIQAMIYFKVNMPTSGFLAEMEGYLDTGTGTYTGTAGALVENPAHILGLLSVQFSGVTAAGDVDLAGLKTVVAPARPGWIFARSLTRADDWSSYVDGLSREALLWTFLDNAGRVTAEPWEDKGGPDLVVGPADVQAGELDSFELSALDQVVTDFEFKYRFNHVRDDYDGLVYCNPSGRSSDLASTWRDLCADTKFSTGGRTRPRTFEFDWIRDRATMLLVAERMIQYFAGRRWTVSFVADLSLCNVELGDQIEFAPLGDWPDNYPPDMIAAKYRVTEVKVRPGRDLVTIKAAEVY